MDLFSTYAMRKCQLPTVLSLNVGTLNVKDVNLQTKSRQSTKMHSSTIYTLAFTETHVKKEESTRITVSNGRSRKAYSVYHGGIKGENPYAGAGLIIEKSLQPHFTRISDRIVKANYIINKDHQGNVIVAYALTLIKSEKTHKLKRGFL